MLIYKNVFPSDFEGLHRGKGNLAHILHRHDEFIADGEARYNTEIEQIEHEIDVAEQKVPTDVLELRRIYAMALLESMPTYPTHIYYNGQNAIETNAIAKNIAFDQIINSQTIIYRNNQGYQQNINISRLQADVNNLKTFNERKEEIKQRSAEFRDAASKRVRALRAKSAVLRSAKFNEVRPTAFRR